MEINLNALNRQALISAQAMMGDFAWGTVALVAGVVTSTIATLWLFAAGILPAWAALLLIAALTYMSYTPLHEAAHGNIHGRHNRLAWFGDLCGHACAPMIMLPHCSHRLEHLGHHRFTNDPGKDPDFHISKMRDGVGSFLVAPWRLLWIHNTYIFRDYWSNEASLQYKITYVAELVFGLGWRVAFLTQVPLMTGIPVIFGGYALGAYFTIYWFAYRPHLPYEQKGRYVDTCTMSVPGWLKPFEWIWLGQTLHSIHHAFPRVPFYRYHSLFNQVEDAMRAHGGQVIDIITREAVPPKRKQIFDDGGIRAS
ncbi:MAG: fatty acid desaturase [Nevskia sp.]|nr:fatty acid desaturase [Nevskia sp.]